MPKIPIFEPYLSGNEKKYIAECIKTGWISSQGEFISRFEKGLAEYHGVRYCVVTSNCTTALHLSLKSLNIGPGDEVLCPALTFIAPANMIVLSGAKLVLVDIHPETLTIDPEKIKAKITRKSKAILVVHQFGHPAHMDEIMAIAAKFGLRVIEDNAESIGARYKGRLLGTIGDISTLSFFANKILTCGEGGAVLTNDQKTAVKSRELRDHGMSINKKYYHVDLGYNYRMTNMQAAIGLAQLEQIDKILRIRKKQMDLYYKLLSAVTGARLRSFAEWSQPVHWMMTLTLDNRFSRSKFLDYMKEKGIDCRQMVNPVHQARHFYPYYKADEFPYALSISRQSAHLPSSTSLTKKEIETVCETALSFLRS